MKVLAVIVSLFLPGIGTMIVGRIGLGIVQFVLMIITGFSIAAIPVIGWIGGSVVYTIIWLWALISVITARDPSA